MKTRDEYEEQFLADFQNHENDDLQVQIGLGAMLILLAQLQLALRHPANCSKTAAFTRDFVEKAIAKLPTEAMRVVMTGGFDAMYDLPFDSSL